MRKFPATSFLLLLCFTAGARDDVALSFAKSLWFDTRNASGLVVTPLESVNTASLGYDFTSGEYHLMQEGNKEGNVFFDTQGAIKVGNVSLWGRFGYDHISSDGSRFNALVYDPFDERYIYSVADTTSSSWKRQRYNLEFKAAVPLVRDKLSGGLYVRYCDKIAAKQHDPRTESFNYEIFVEPSLSFVTGNMVLGFSACYSNSMERSVPTLSNTYLVQNVFVLRGLGNYTDDTVGSGGLNPMYFRTNLFGGALQFGISDRMVAEAGVDWSSTELSQSPTQPRPMGRSNILDIHACGTCTFRERNLHRVGLTGHYIHTGGTEYSTKPVSGEGWIIATESLMSTYSTIKAAATYDGFLMDGKDWKWNFAARAAYTSKSDRYLAPVSIYKWSNVSIDGTAVRKIHFRAATLRLSASAILVKGLSGEYSYSGNCSAARTVTEWYPWNLAYHKADSYGAALGCDWGLMFRSSLELHFAVDASALKSSLSTFRNSLCGKVCLVF